MSNCISFVGRLGSDPERKDVGSSQVLEFRIANDTGFGDRKVTSWFRCAYWGKRGASVQQYLSKGKQVFIIGELTLRKYEKDGQERISPEINIQQLDFVGGREPDAPKQDTGNEDTENMPF